VLASTVLTTGNPEEDRKTKEMVSGGYGEMSDKMYISISIFAVAISGYTGPCPGGMHPQQLPAAPFLLPLLRAHADESAA
jgi:hypothetical protein